MACFQLTENYLNMNIKSNLIRNNLAHLVLLVVITKSSIWNIESSSQLVSERRRCHWTEYIWLL